MFRNMVTSLFEHERIETTDAKAKELRRLADKMVTLAKKGDLHARRQALAIIRSKQVTHKLFGEIRERYLERNGGYVRVLKKGYRVGDGAPVSIIELVPTDKGKKSKKEKKGAKKLTERLKLKKDEKAAGRVKSKKQKEEKVKPEEKQEPQKEETAPAPADTEEAQVEDKVEEEGDKQEIQEKTNPEESS